MVSYGEDMYSDISVITDPHKHLLRFSIKWFATIPHLLRFSTKKVGHGTTPTEVQHQEGGPRYYTY